MTPEALAAKYFPESDERAARAAACVREALATPPQTPQPRKLYRESTDYQSDLDDGLRVNRAPQTAIRAQVEKLKPRWPDECGNIVSAVEGYKLAIADVLAFCAETPSTKICTVSEADFLAACDDVGAETPPQETKG